MKWPDWYFSADIAQFFFKNARWPIMFFFLRQRKFSCVGVAEIIYNIGRLGFFVRAQPTFYFGRNWHVPIYSATKNLAHLGKKIFFTDIDRKIWQSTSTRKDDRSRCNKEASPHDADRTFPYRHHAYFLKGLNRKLNSRHRSWSRPTDTFQPTLRNFFLQTLAGR